MHVRPSLIHTRPITPDAPFFIVTKQYKRCGDRSGFALHLDQPLHHPSWHSLTVNLPRALIPLSIRDRPRPCLQAQSSPCAYKSSNATRSAAASTTATPSTPVQQGATADMASKRRPSSLATHAANTPVAARPRSRLLCATYPQTLATRAANGTIIISNDHELLESTSLQLLCFCMLRRSIVDAVPRSLQEERRPYLSQPRSS